jgi:hypothetical protein
MFDPIEDDFDVKKISESDMVSFYAATKGGLWHFVWSHRDFEDPRGQNLSNYSINQAYIPRYSLAAELKERLEFISLIGDEEIDSENVLVGDEFWPGFFVGVTSDKRVMLVTTAGYVYPLHSAALIAIGDIARLEAASAAVMEDDGAFVLPSVLTNAGNRVSYKNKRLVDAVSFERELHSELDPVNRFEIFSAFCTLVDSSLSRNLPKSYVERIVHEQKHINVEDVGDEVAQLLLQIQNTIFPTSPVLGDEDDVSSDTLTGAVSDTLGSLNDAQRCQFVLLRDLHQALFLINLAAVTGTISFQKYCETMTIEVAPDSPTEQAIRSQSAFIELLGILA